LLFVKNNMKNITKKIIRHSKKILLAPKNLFYWFLNIPLKPKWVVLMATDMCNSRCNHCNIWKEKSTPNPLTPKELEKIFSDKLFKNVEYILCTGGEATLRTDFKEMIMAMHRALPNAVIQLSTNAILQEKGLDIVKFALENNIKFDIGVSLDGIGDAHDKIRGVPGNFEKADWLLKESIKLREKYGPEKLHVGAGAVVSDLTVDSIYQTREYAKNMGIDFVEAWYNTSSFYGNYSEGDKSKIKEKITKIVKSQCPSVMQDKWLSFLKGKSIKFPCFAINSFFVLKCNGDIVPCLSHWDASIGNVRDHSPSEVWYGKKAKEARQFVKKCPGCLNNWGAGWSFESSYYQILFFYLKRPDILIKKLLSKE